MPLLASGSTLKPSVLDFLETTSWRTASCESITGDASARKYFRLRKDNKSAILMDASQALESVAPFIQIDEHLQALGLSAPIMFAWDKHNGFILLEDFGNATFTSLLEQPSDQEKLYTLATDVLIALHTHPKAIPANLRAYHPQKMLDDIELFLEWCVPAVTEKAREDFRRVWLETLSLAHQVPCSLLLRDYHVANLMLLPERQGIRQAGLLDFQDAYQGPITYDLMSLLEDARRDVPEGLKAKLMAYYLDHFPTLAPKAFAASIAILAALRHTRVLAIFERLSRRDGKHDYKALHSPRVQRLLHKALSHPMLSRVQQWFKQHAQ